MNIAIFSSRASYHHLAQIFEKENNVENIYHFGANKFLEETDKYHPIPYDLSDIKEIPENTIDQVCHDIGNLKIDFAMASNLAIPRSKKLHDTLQDNKVPYFFVYPGMTTLETDRISAKIMCKKIDIPHLGGEMMSGEELKEKFMKLSRPFVIKLIAVWQNGRQTIIVDDENYETVFNELFSIYLTGKPHIMNIGLETKIWVEDFIKLKREYSYHMLVNEHDWRFFGCARDYKRYNEGDQGFNTIGMGAYNIDDVDPRVHNYAEKIFNYVQDYVKSSGRYYRGFMFLGIGIDENDKPWILEINTRSGDPELNAILPEITTSLSELFYSASANTEMPLIKRNDKKIVTMRLVNKIFDWTKPASLLPKFPTPAEDYGITYSLQGLENNNYYLNHSLFTADDNSHERANEKILKYLDSQYLGQFKVRRDIGILK